MTSKIRKKHDIRESSGDDEIGNFTTRNEFTFTHFALGSRF